ncbi:hypothetical protein PC123_g20692 [Phytophthora cactorum]|nr:hypothetical protein PC123_g20692 [Phytophthora cactorum]
MHEQFREHREGESQEADVTSFSPTAPLRAKLIKWLDSSWSSLPKAAIVGGFSRIGTSSDQREAPETESRYEEDLQNVLQILAKSGAAIDVENEAEEEIEH